MDFSREELELIRKVLNGTENETAWKLAMRITKELKKEDKPAEVKQVLVRSACSGMSISEAMENVKAVRSKKELVALVNEWGEGYYKTETLDTYEYGYDKRIGWNSWLITADTDEYKAQAVFFANGDFRELPEE
jgi:hypothetical protein